MGFPESVSTASLAKFPESQFQVQAWSIACLIGRSVCEPKKILILAGKMRRRGAMVCWFRFSFERSHPFNPHPESGLQTLRYSILFARSDEVGLIHYPANPISVGYQSAKVSKRCIELAGRLALFGWESVEWLVSLAKLTNLIVPIHRMAVTFQHPANSSTQFITQT